MEINLHPDLFDKIWEASIDPLGKEQLVSAKARSVAITQLVLDH